MARRKEQKKSAVERIYERALGWSALLLIAFHSWISFARHFFAPENQVYGSSVMKALMTCDKWLVLALLCAGIIYLILVRTQFTKSWIHVKQFMRQACSKEWSVLIALFVWYMLCCLVQGKGTGEVIRSYEWWILDLAICILVMFPMGKAVGVRGTKKWLEVIMHAIMIFSTAFIVWALWNLFRLNIVTLPNGLQLGMTSGYAFYAGVNQNIAAAIGVCMVLISVYMMATQRWILKLVYAIALVPHLIATLLTNSRGSYLSLQLSLPIVVFMATWKGMKQVKQAKKVIFSCIMAVLTALIFWWLRRAVFDLFEAVTHLRELLGIESENVVREVGIESARLKIWRSTLNVMFSSVKRFFFGVSLGDSSYAIQEAMNAIYGPSQLFAHAHNIILQVGLCMGVPAMVTFVIFLVMLAVRCVRVGIGVAKGSFSGAYVLPIAVLAMVIINMFEAFLVLYVSITACIFFLFGGWITAIDSEIKRK